MSQPNPPKILLVDDHAIVRRGTRQLLCETIAQQAAQPRPRHPQPRSSKAAP